MLSRQTSSPSRPGVLRWLVRVGAAIFVLGSLSRAHSAALLAHYESGWNMAGGPAGTSLVGAEARFVYGAEGYVAPSGPTTATCQGEWAYFAAPSDVVLATAESTKEDCSLRPGWNMVGDPFNDPALLPAGVIGYVWDPSTEHYLSAGQVPSGGAVWLYSETATSVSLQAAPEGSLTLFGIPAAGKPVQIHAGEYLTLVVHATGSGPSWVAKGDPRYLQLLGSGTLATGDYYYRWQARTPGDTSITLDPGCLRAGCAQPSLIVRITILP